MKAVLELFKIRMGTKEKIAMFAILMLSMFAATVYVAYGEQVAYGDNSGLLVFYNLQTAGYYLWFFIILVFIIPNIFAVDILKDQKRHYHFFEITSLGYKKYCKKNLLDNCLLVFITMLVMQIVILLFIQLFISPLNFSEATSSLETLMLTNATENLIFYIIASSVGCTVFSMLLLALQSIVKNVNMFRAIGLCVGIVLFIAPVILSGFLETATNSTIFSNVIGLFCISNILLPSLENYNIPSLSPLAGYFGTLIFYTLLSLYIYYLKSKKEYHRE